MVFIWKRLTKPSQTHAPTRTSSMAMEVPCRQGNLPLNEAGVLLKMVVDVDTTAAVTPLRAARRRVSLTRECATPPSCRALGLAPQACAAAESGFAGPGPPPG